MLYIHTVLNISQAHNYSPLELMFAYRELLRVVQSAPRKMFQIHNGFAELRRWR